MSKEVFTKDLVCEHNARLDGFTRGEVRDLLSLFKAREERGLPAFDPAKPILLSPDGKVIGGSRRIAAARFYGLVTVPVEHSDCAMDPLSVALAGASDNAGRKDLTPYEIAGEAAHLTELGAKVTQIAGAFAVDKGYVSKLIQCYKRATKATHEAWRAGLSVNAVRRAVDAGGAPEAQAKIVAAEIRAQGEREAAAAGKREARKAGKAPTSPAPTSDAEIQRRNRENATGAFAGNQPATREERLRAFVEILVPIDPVLAEAVEWLALGGVRPAALPPDVAKAADEVGL